MPSRALSPTDPARPATGGLREALIEAGIKLLCDGGTEALTLRRAAALAGVSHAAPAHHFNGLSGLLTAIAARAYAEFSATMIAARDAAKPLPFDRLAAVCDGYLAFARHRAGLFRVMFTTPAIDRSDQDFCAASQTAYRILREACAPFQTIPPELLELTIWSAVHGYALLEFQGASTEGRGFGTVPPFRAILARIVGAESVTTE